MDKLKTLVHQKQLFIRKEITTLHEHLDRFDHLFYLLKKEIHSISGNIDFEMRQMEIKLKEVENE